MAAPDLSALEAFGGHSERFRHEIIRVRRPRGAAGVRAAGWQSLVPHCLLLDCLLAHAYAVIIPLQVFLIFGKSGWIGGLVGDLLKQQGAKFEYANARLEDRSSIVAELDRVRTGPQYRMR